MRSRSTTLLEKKSEREFKMSEKATRDFNLQDLKGCIENLTRECMKAVIDIDDLDYEYQGVQKSWETYMQSQMALVATIKSNETVSEESQAHKLTKHEYETAVKLHKKTSRKLKEKGEPLKEELSKNVAKDIKSKKVDLENSISHLENELKETDTKLNAFQLSKIESEALELKNFYRKEIMAAYGKLMDLSTEVNKDKARKEMDDGLEIIKKRYWAIVDLVNIKKGKVALETPAVGDDVTVSVRWYVNLEASKFP